MKRGQKVLVGSGAVVLLLAGAVLVLPPLLFREPGDWSHVVSIEKDPQYQRSDVLERMWQLPVAASYRAGLDFQGNPSFCGPTSVVNVVRSFGQGADQQTILEGTGRKTWFGVLPGGLTLDELAEVARRRTGKTVDVLRGVDLAAFREHLRQSNALENRYIVNFSRAPLFGRGGGHHSPIGGYLEAEDLVFVVDVNAKFKPWVVSSQRLFEAVDTTDRASGKKRGLLRIH